MRKAMIEYMAVFSLVVVLGMSAPAQAQGMKTVAPINQSSIDQPDSGEKTSKDAEETVQEAPPIEPQMPNALLTVRFNSARVYYDRALAQAIAGARAIKPLATYEIISFEPVRAANSASGQTRLNEAYARNLKDLMNKMQQQGVSADRMRPERKSSEDVNDQEIQIFVK